MTTKRTKRTELSDWQIAALEKSLSDAIERGTIDGLSGQNLLNQIATAKSVTIHLGPR